MKAFAIAAIAATALTLTGCGENLGKGQPLNVVSGHIVMGATDDRPAVGYFRIEGGPQPVQLVAVDGFDRNNVRRCRDHLEAARMVLDDSIKQRLVDRASGVEQVRDGAP